jgi:hypothetical protein
MIFSSSIRTLSGTIPDLLHIRSYQHQRRFLILLLLRTGNAVLLLRKAEVYISSVPVVVSLQELGVVKLGGMLGSASESMEQRSVPCLVQADRKGHILPLTRYLTPPGSCLPRPLLHSYNNRFHSSCDVSPHFFGSLSPMGFMLHVCVPEHPVGSHILKQVWECTERFIRVSA